MRISHDDVSGALYIKLREGKYDHTEDFSEKADVYLDVDADGNVLGLEALSFENLALAIEERGGKLELPGRIAHLPEGAGEGFTAEIPDDDKDIQERIDGGEARSERLRRRT